MRAALQRLLTVIFVVLAGTAVSGCASRPGPELLDTALEPVPGAKVVTVYVATTRDRNIPGSKAFGEAWGRQTGYAAYRISLPPDHKQGQIEWPNGKPDPAHNFVTVEQRPLDHAAFASTVARRGASGQPPKVWVFVHGFNTNFQEAVYRLAQMVGDSGTDTVPILFAWPSAGTVTGYVADKDAATYSRDALANLLTELAQEKTTGKITLIGHSMGGWLTAETLRQLRIAGRGKVLERLQVVLAAPDIDVDVFREQMAVVGRMDPPLTVLVSSDDLALRVSGRIAGARKRLGALDVDDPRVQELALQYDLRIIDISGLQASDEFKHDRFVGLAAIYPKLQEQQDSRPDLQLRRAGAFVFNAVGTTLSAPFSLAGQALTGE
ncbi:alpha/beta fold hydrolase [Ancylobacter sp. 6x-1]|uniref:Alpha/beta fold hydrolase n=2 Tax=Ancylobacter crimeensis TaxID=2579147 RepID=A0ABT0DD40_9HYPH|nr:alpha/beta fold hydrolase [Ancylobacter crimeensis]